MRKNKKIARELLASILTVIIIGLALISVIGCFVSVASVRTEIKKSMNAELEKERENIIRQMEDIETMTYGLASAFGPILEKEPDLDILNNAMKRVVADNEMVTAVGFFLEPGAYKGQQNCYSYVANTEEGAVAVDLGEMEYTDITWYVAAKETGEPQREAVYVDATLGELMTSYIEPIFDSSGKYIGAINTDINMSAIQKRVDEIQIGKTGKMQLINMEGQYVTGVDADKVLSVNIAEDTENGLSKVVDRMIEGEKGILNAKTDGINYRYYYTTIETYDWIMLVRIKESEINESAVRQIRTTGIVSFLIIAVVGIVVIVEAKRISGPIKAVKDMSQAMAGGDFSIEPIHIKSRNELGLMTDALNEMLHSNKDEMTLISKNSQKIGKSSQILQNAVGELRENVQKINEAIHMINDAMVDNSATTQEVAAAVTEVKNNIANLQDMATKSQDMSNDIMARAQNIGVESNQSFDNAMDLSGQFQKRLHVSIENSKVVNDIGTMAVAISEIAEEINLLALNASIEAARAGEHGKGFAVVATEIGNLANQTSNTVSSIQETVSKVQESVDVLTEDSKALINFIIEDVTPDYKKFTGMSEQYKGDAADIQELSNYLADMASQLLDTMESVSVAVGNIADASEAAVAESTIVTDSVEQVTGQVKSIKEISEEQNQISTELGEVVSNYKI